VFLKVQIYFSSVLLNTSPLYFSLLEPSGGREVLWGPRERSSEDIFPGKEHVEPLMIVDPRVKS